MYVYIYSDAHTVGSMLHAKTKEGAIVLHGACEPHSDRGCDMVFSSAFTSHVHVLHARDVDACGVHVRVGFGRVDPCTICMCIQIGLFKHVCRLRLTSQARVSLTTDMALITHEAAILYMYTTLIMARTCGS
jgi:hypothetical protein